MPQWARFFIDLGCQTALACRRSQNRLVVASAVPSRAYAAAFMAAGVVVTRSTRGGNSQNVKSYFQSLIRLPIGTALLYRQGDRIYPAILDGVSDFEGEPRIRVRTQDRKAGGLTDLIPAHRARDISVLPTNECRLLAKPRQLRVCTDFLNYWLQGADPHTFVSDSQLHCLVLGNVGQLFGEIGCTPQTLVEPGILARASFLLL